MRVYFGVCGIGLGHAGRCIPIAKTLRQSGYDVLFSTYCEAVDYVRREGLPLVEAPSIGFVVKPDGSIDFRQTTAKPGPLAPLIFMRQLNKELQLMQSFQPDLVISDSRASTLIAARLLGIPKITIVNQYRVIIPRKRRFLRLSRVADGGILTIIGRVWTMGDSVLIPDFPPPYTISEGNLGIPPMRRRKVKLIGPILPIKPDDLPEKGEIRERLGFEEDDPLIFVPISGPVREKAFLIGVLRKLLQSFPGDYRVVMSMGYPDTPIMPHKKGGLTVYGWLPDRFEYLKACDVLIARAGLGTVTQSMCYGKPAIYIPTPNHTEQLNNSRRVEALGVARVIQQEKLDSMSLLSEVEAILTDAAYRRRIEEIQREVLNYDAVRTVSELVAEYKG